MNAIFNMEKDRKKTGKCRCTLLPDKLVVRNNGLFLQKRSRFTKNINMQYDTEWETIGSRDRIFFCFSDRLLLFGQAGLGRYLEIKYASSTTACSIAALTRGFNDPTKLTLSQLAVPFVLLAIGCVLSFIAFLVERGHGSAKRRETRIRMMLVDSI